MTLNIPTNQMRPENTRRRTPACGFAGGKFDAAWAFGWLEKVLARTDISRSNMFVFNHMSKLFSQNPSESLHCLSLFIKQNMEPWFFGRQKGVKDILSQAMAHDDQNIRNQAEDIIHRLGAMGFLEYGDLLQKN